MYGNIQNVGLTKLNSFKRNLNSDHFNITTDNLEKTTVT